MRIESEIKINNNRSKKIMKTKNHTNRNNYPRRNSKHCVILN